MKAVMHMADTEKKLYRIKADCVTGENEPVTYEGYWEAHNVAEALDIFGSRYAKCMTYESISIAEVRGCERSKGISGAYQVV